MNYIISDTRQQQDKHKLKEQWFQERGITLVHSKAVVGDYTLPPTVSIDTKRSMDEIAGNIGGSTKEHERFRRELMLAQQIGCKLYILVENYEGINNLSQVQYWDNPRLEMSPQAITGARLFKAMCTMQERYGVTFLFCTPEESAEIIYRILEDEQKKEIKAKEKKD